MTRPHLEDLIAMRLKGKEFDTAQLEGRLYLPFNQIVITQYAHSGAISAEFFQQRGDRRVRVHEVRNLARMGSAPSPYSSCQLEGLLFVQEQPSEPLSFKDRYRSL